MISVGDPTVGAVLDGLVSRLEKTSDTPGLDAQVLLAHLFEKPRSWLMAHPEVSLTAHQQSGLEALLARLEGGEPLPYVLGRWEFFGLEFEVTPDVLIPRPETELLVERAIAWLQTRPEYDRAIDIGTGSGCIGIALAANVPGLHVTATDLSAKALAVAKRNAVKHGLVDRVDFVRHDLFPAEGLFNLIISNPPYIASGTLHGLPVYHREPTLALDGGPDGLDLIRRILAQAPDRLLPGGLLLMEIEASEGPAVLSLVYDSFAEAEIHLYKDLAGNERLLEVQV